MSSGNSDSFTSSFPMWRIFTYFFSVIVVARTSNTMLNRSSESGHPCFVTDFRGKTFRFSLWCMMLAVGLSKMAFMMLRYVSSVLNLMRVFIMKGY